MCETAAAFSRAVRSRPGQPWVRGVGIAGGKAFRNGFRDVHPGVLYSMGVHADLRPLCEYNHEAGV